MRLPRTDKYYRLCLADELRLFAWCFVNVGGRTEQEARQAAHEFYKREPPEGEDRWFVLFEGAWYWAMRELFGATFLQTHPELAVPRAEYENEARRDEWESPSTTAPDASAH